MKRTVVLVVVAAAAIPWAVGLYLAYAMTVLRVFGVELAPVR